MTHEATPTSQRRRCKAFEDLVPNRKRVRARDMIARQAAALKMSKEDAKQDVVSHIELRGRPSPSLSFP